MTTQVLALRQPVARLRDFIELGKPRLSMLVVFTSAIGVWLAPSGLGPVRTAAFLFATTCLVFAANTLNCWIEREHDGRMERTRTRPLPAGRLEPRAALVSGCVLSFVSLLALALTTNGLTTGLGALALVLYVAVYTPLKRVTPWAMLVGAVPGALPPLMGYTAATGELGLRGFIPFLILFAWQLPHFTAISLYLSDDFRRGGYPVLPVAQGAPVARRWLFAFTLLTVAASLIAQPLGAAGTAYTSVALAAGIGFVAVAAGGLGRGAGTPWATRVFGYTLVYLPVVVTILVLDAR